MRKEIIYYADDGTKFDDEYECEEYEQKIKSNKFKDTALLFDEYGKRLYLTSDGYESAVYIVCKTSEAAEFIYEQMGHSLYTPWDSYRATPCAGCWKWDNDVDKWVSVEELLKEAEDIVALFKKILSY